MFQPCSINTSGTKSWKQRITWRGGANPLAVSSPRVWHTPHSGSNQGEVVFYASTETTAPNEAFHQWKIQTSSRGSIFIKPQTQTKTVRKQIQMNETQVTVFTTLLGLDGTNTFTLSSGKLQCIDDHYTCCYCHSFFRYRKIRSQWNSTDEHSFCFKLFSIMKTYCASFVWITIIPLLKLFLCDSFYNGVCVCVP